MDSCSGLGYLYAYEANMRIRSALWCSVAWFMGVGFTLSCSLGGGSSDLSLTIQETRTFNAQSLSGVWEKVSADLRYVGSHCLVYVDETESSWIPDTVVTEIGEAFDSKAYPIVTQYFGDLYDVDRNGKVILLLLDIQDGYTEGASGYVAGYFDYSHMYSVSTFSHSNEADMIFLDTYPGLRTASGAIDPVAKEDLKLTMAHEFQHLVNYSEKVIRQGSQMDTWINEGLSAAAEYLYLGKHVQWKIDYFNQVQYQLSLSQTYNPLKDANLWGQYFISWGRWGDPLVNYSTVYLFFQWLRIQAGNTSMGAPEVYKSILQERFSDYRAVVNAFNASTGANWTWKEIFRSWLLANLLNQATGRYGYKNQLTDEQGRVVYLYPRFIVNLPTDPTKIYPRGSYPPFSVSGDTAGKAFLLPGDAVYVKLSSDRSLSDTDPIAYSSVSFGEGDPVLHIGSSTYLSGEILIAGNVRSFNGTLSQDLVATDPLVDPGIGENSTVVGITNLTPPEAGWIPKGSTSMIQGPAGKSLSRPPRRPLPMDALLGSSEQEKREPWQ